MKKIFKKLIRDKIPEIIEQDNKKPNFFVLDDEQFRKSLKIKLIEESEELVQAHSKENILNELCDVQEVICAIAKNYGFSMEDLEKQRKKKFIERGGFEKKLFLEEVTWEENDE